jgi:VWFA-related protein
MSVSPARLAVFLASLPWAAMACSAQAGTGQAFSGAIAPAGMEGGLSAASAPDSGAYASGTRAINEGRWADAVTIFRKVWEMHGEYADGALYWKAYAENKQGQASHALDTCVELRRDFPRSRWIDECGALEIEIRARSGQPVQQTPVQDEDLKLLELNSLMRQDEPRALAQIQEILNGDSPERLKERAVFILTQSQSKQAQDLLGKIALGKLNPAHPNPALQTRATGLLRGLTGKVSGSPYPPAGNGNQAITVDVVVTDKSGAPVAGLGPNDFKLFDNKQPQPLTSVQAANGMSAKADPPIETVLLVDAVNPTFLTVANERQWLEAFLNQNGRELALPTSIIVLTDQGMKIQEHPTRDGKALLDYLNANATGLRAIRRSEGLEGELEREQHSLVALDFLAAQESKRPGRKLLIWLSPGWYVYSDLLGNWRAKHDKSIFANITAISTALREARITLYSIDPGGVDHGRFFYQNYLKGVDAPKHADFGDLFLQVLATQSGGQVFFGNNDLAGLIDRCVADAKAYYVLTFNPPPAAHPDEYHALEVEVDKPGLKARTRTGYYAQPSAQGVQSFPESSLEKPAN